MITKPRLIYGRCQTRSLGITTSSGSKIAGNFTLKWIADNPAYFDFPEKISPQGLTVISSTFRPTADQVACFDFVLVSEASQWNEPAASCHGASCPQNRPSTNERWWHGRQAPYWALLSFWQLDQKLWQLQMPYLASSPLLCSQVTVTRRICDHRSLTQ